MLIKVLRPSLLVLMLVTLISIIGIVGTYLVLKPTLPEINLVDEDILQIPLKVFSSDGILIGEFGDQKRRTIEYNDIPLNLKNAFLAAEDDKFFEHNGIRILSFVRAFFQLIESREIISGGGTITMQVVRGYLLSREQRIIRKIKEIYLAFELESNASKEEILSLYLNTIFLGNRAYGVESAANKYFGKSIDELTLAESALIASSAQLPSRINPIRSPERSTVRRNWILGRMYKLGYIGKAQFLIARTEPISLAQSDSTFQLDAQYIAEAVRQSMIARYGLSVYQDGLSVFTTINSSLQSAAIKSISKNLFAYDKRHGWREPLNFFDQLPDNFFSRLSTGDLEVLYQEYGEQDELGMDQSLISIIRDIFNQGIFLDTHNRAIVIDIKPERIIYLDEQFNLQTLPWSEEYKWAKRRITINKFGPTPQNFYDILSVGDLVYLLEDKLGFKLDQIPEAEAALISIHPSSGAVKAYVGGFNFSKSNFDRVKLSFPQVGSSFKPFIYSAAFANGYKASDKINDAPIVFEDKNLESIWRPENYTGKFYGPIRLREALIQSVNLVSIKLLREVGIINAQDYLTNFGFTKARLSPDLSLALGSSSFSPAEMVRAYGILANDGQGQDLYFIEKIIDRNGDIVFQHPLEETINQELNNIDAFPWFETDLLGDQSMPFLLLPSLENKDRSIDPRIAFIAKDILREALQRGSNGRKTKILNRSDFAGKTGTTNDSISTWFSGFHKELASTVWIGTDNFSSLGDNEYGSSTALPTWVDFMQVAKDGLEIDDWKAPAGVSYVRVSRDSGKPIENLDEDSYFELFLDE